MLASRNQVDELPVINMTPMVDVILCLLGVLHGGHQVV